MKKNYKKNVYKIRIRKAYLKHNLDSCLAPYSTFTNLCTNEYLKEFLADGKKNLAVSFFWSKTAKHRQIKFPPS